MRKMFEVDKKRIKTGSVITGCFHDCIYCWFRNLVNGKLKDTKKYKECGTRPCFHEKELKKSFGKNNIWFVTDMGDMWGSWVEDEWIKKVLEKVSKADSSNIFYFLTKNPARYQRYVDERLFTDNCVLGATIETNRHYPDVSKAPPPESRYKALLELRFPKKFIAIEPVMDFDLEVLRRWILDIFPEFVYIGYDNYRNSLPEPSLEKVRTLIYDMEYFTEVRQKTIREAR